MLADKPRARSRGLNARELDILKAVASLSVATAEDLRRFLALASRPHLGELLKGLCGGTDRNTRGYLYRFGMPQAPGNTRRLYTLTRRGRQVLLDHGLDVPGMYRPEKASLLSFSFLQHHLAVTKCQVAITLFVRKFTEFQMQETRAWFAMAGNPPRLTRFIDEAETTITVIPDLWVYLERIHEDPAKTQGFRLWFEIDRGTEAKEKFQHYVLQRINFVRYKGYEAYFNDASVLLVFLVSGATIDYRLRRLHRIRAWTMEVLIHENLSDWAGTFLYSTIDETLYDTLMLFTDPVFYHPDSDTLVPLFSPPEKENTHGQSTPACDTDQTP